MVKRWKKFLESQNSELDEGIEIMSEISDIFIDLDDELGFNLGLRLGIGKNYYDLGGNIVDQIHGNRYLVDSWSNGIDLVGYLEGTTIEVVQDSAVKIKSKIDVGVVGILGDRIGEISGNFRFWLLGYVWQSFDISKDEIWYNSYGRKLQSDINLFKSNHPDGKFGISFELHFQI